GVSPRQFAHEPIAELPHHVADRPWADAVLSVLQHATQTRPESRYQSVKDFWDDLSAASWPEDEEEADLLLEASPVSITSDLTAPPSVVTVAAPPKPRFETSKELQQEQLSNGARPRIVVPIANSRNVVAEGPSIAATQPSGRVTVAVPAAPKHDVPARRTLPGSGSRWRVLIVSLGLILVFAGMLWATRNYIRKRWAQQTVEQTTLVGRE